MTFGEFLYDRLGKLVLLGVLIVSLSLFLLATGTSGGIVILVLIILVLVSIVVQIVDFAIMRKHLEELDAVMESLDKKYLFAECVTTPKNAYERKILELSRRAGKHMIQAISDAEAEQREYREYVESWVHEIKTPITAAGLICRNAEPELRRKLTQELAQIEAHVERALFYARAGSPEKDFIVRQTELSEIVSQAVNQHRALLIQSGVQVETDGLDQTVYTDGKWAEFIIGQLLQNAARYKSEQPKVSIYAKKVGKLVQLEIRDNGIGIQAHELPRVFDRGFTGSNGRSRGGSTGMGLYLCKRLADCLEIQLQIKSAEGEGTTVTLVFPAKGNLSEM